MRLPFGFTLDDWYKLLGIAALLCGGAIWLYRKAGVPAWRYVRKRFDRVMDALDSVEVIRKEMFPNGGGSLRDRIDGTARVVNMVSATLGEMAKHVSMSVAQNRTLFDQMDVGMLEGDEEGEIVWANRAFRRLTGLRIEQITGSGWINAIHEDDRRRVENEWRLATGLRRPFVAMLRLVHVGTGVMVPIHFEASPVIVDAESDKGAGWIALARIREVES